MMTQTRGGGGGVAGKSECGRGEREHVSQVCWAVEQGGRAHDLSEAQIRTLQGIAVGDRTWTDVGQLGRMGLNGSTLAGLIASSWVEQFVTEDGPAVTFSSFAAEVLGLDVTEHWEIYPGVVDQEDSSGERTSSPVRFPHEIPRFEARPLPREPGMPKPRRVPIKLPFLFHLSGLPEDVIAGLKSRSVPTPLDEAIAHEEFLLQESRLEDGRLDVDEESGRVKTEPIILFGQKVPREKAKARRGTKGGKKRRGKKK
jgi:hypothetical protein